MSPVISEGSSNDSGRGGSSSLQSPALHNGRADTEATTPTTPSSTVAAGVGRLISDDR